MSENILKNVKNSNLKKLWTITTSYTTHLRCFLLKYTCEKNTLLMFYYMIFNNEHEHEIS